MGIDYLIRAYKETIKIYEDKSDELDLEEIKKIWRIKYES